MGKEVYDAFQEARDVFAEVDEVLGQHLTKLIFEGPLDTLTLTENTQPALMATSIAIFRCLLKQGNLKLKDFTQYVAGHSLGEYTALCASGALSLADTARLLRIRGKAMQEAVPQGKGGMGVLLGVDLDVAKQIATRAAQNDVCQVANDNSPGQVVISGSAVAIARAAPVAAELGAKRLMPLNVSAPFHSILMQPAAEKMQQALAEVQMNAPEVPLITNVTAEKESDPVALKKLLVDQVTGMVRWRESMLYMEYRGIGQVVEVGAGKVLAGLAKRCSEHLDTFSVNSPRDIEGFLEQLQKEES
jgi:[acyl-carrier-protein] S-malonyltransferase